MRRTPAILLSSAGIALAVLAGADAVGAAAPPPPTQPPTTVAPAAPVDPAPTTTVAPPPAGTRGGSAAGGIAKPADESWDVRRIAATTGIVVIGLAGLGYAYGKSRSAPPRHPDLVRQPDDLA